jgi:glyoxylate utilization-related uncharacterized protein
MKDRRRPPVHVVNVDDLVAQHFCAHGGAGEIQMKFAFSELASMAGCNWKVFGVAVFPEGATAGLHSHIGDEEFFYVLSGSASIVVDGEQRRISKGDIVLTRDGSSHEVRDVNEPLTMIVIEIKKNR